MNDSLDNEFKTSFVLFMDDPFDFKINFQK